MSTEYLLPTVTLAAVIIFKVYDWLTAPKLPPPGYKLQQNEAGQWRATNPELRWTQITWYGYESPLVQTGWRSDNYRCRRSALKAALEMEELRQEQQRQNNWKDAE